MKDHPRIAAARVEAEAARARLRGTAFEAKARLSPAAIADRAVEGVKDRAMTVVADGVAVVRKRPVVIGAAVGAITLLVGLRPIRRLLGHTTQLEADDRVSPPPPKSRKAR